MKRLLALLLCAVMIISALSLVACGDDGKEKVTDNKGNKESTKSTETEQGEVNLTDEIPDGKYDFKGREFIIASPSVQEWGPDKYDITELTNDIVNDAVYYRNRAVEQRFNVKISAPFFSTFSTDTWVEQVSPHILSDDGAFNLMAFAYSTGSYGLISSGLLCPWNDIPVINYEKPWWNKSSINCGTLNGTTFFNAGSINWYSIGFTEVFMFNENIRQQAGIGDLYAMVDNGEWTMDKLTELSRLVAKDNGDGKWNKKDTYGVTGNGMDQMSIGCDWVSVVNNGDGTYQINLGDEKHQQIFEKVLNLMKKENHIAYNGTDAKIFIEDRALFTMEWLFNIEQYRNMESDFGIIPFPKFDEAQENYCSFSQAWGLANALPICTKPEDYEMIGVIMESLSCASYNDVLPAYYEYVLKGRESRDTESWRMLDLINNTLVYDFGYFYTVGNSANATTLPFYLLIQYGREKTDLASFCAENRESWESQYDEIMTFGKSE